MLLETAPLSILELRDNLQADQLRVDRDQLQIDRPRSRRRPVFAATGTEGSTHRKTVVPISCPSDSGSVRFDAETETQGISAAFTPKAPNSLETKGFARDLINTGEATRTPDLRIMRPPL